MLLHTPAFPGGPAVRARCDAVWVDAQYANLWDVSSAPTIVMTQRGARRAFQDTLCAAGVEVVQFDFLTPEAVAAYCQERGFLQVPRSMCCMRFSRSRLCTYQSNLP